MTGLEWARLPVTSRTFSSSRPTTRCEKTRRKLPGTCSRVWSERPRAATTRSSSTGAPRSGAPSRSRVRATPCCWPARGTSARCRGRRALSRGMRGRRRGRRSGAGPRRSAAADHAHDLDDIAVFEPCVRVARPFDDEAVELDRDRSWAHAELLEVRKQLGRPFELDAAAVDLHTDHSLNIVIAAYPAAPAAWHSSMRSPVTPPLARTGIRTTPPTQPTHARPPT